MWNPVVIEVVEVAVIEVAVIVIGARCLLSPSCLADITTKGVVHVSRDTQARSPLPHMESANCATSHRLVAMVHTDKPELSTANVFEGVTLNPTDPAWLHSKMLDTTPHPGGNPRLQSRKSKERKINPVH